MLAPITKFISYAGLIPFILLSGLIQLMESPWDFWAANSLLLYSASITSFVGALHWGPLLMPKSNPQSHQFWRDKGAWVWGVTPSLLAWIALHMSFSYGYFVIAATLIATLIVDKMQFRHLIEDQAYLNEFLKMRTVLTVVASASLIWAGLAIRQF